MVAFNGFWLLGLAEQEDDDRGGSGDLRFLATRMENEAGVEVEKINK
jgi:hypothetical protein